MLKPVCSSTVLLVLLGAFAQAADVADAGGRTTDWGGPWVGVLGAAGRIGGDGALIGVSGGYAAQFEQIVIGIDGDVSGGGIDARRAGGRFDVEALGAIRARVGYAFDRFVLFGAAGVAFASTEFARSGEKDHETLFGWTVGGGIDARLTEQLSARAEYLYVDLDRRRFDAGGVSGFGPSGGIARLGLNYRF